MSVGSDGRHYLLRSQLADAASCSNQPNLVLGRSILIDPTGVTEYQRKIWKTPCGSAFVDDRSRTFGSINYSTDESLRTMNKHRRVGEKRDGRYRGPYQCRTDNDESPDVIPKAKSGYSSSANAD